LAYKIEFKPAALRRLEELPREAQKHIAAKIEALRDNPFPAGCKKLRGEANLWRLRAGDYRVIYQIHSHVLTILIINIGHRREIYR